MKFAALDRRIIYLCVAVALAFPLLRGYTVAPAKLAAADRLYEAVESLPVGNGQVAFVGVDWGPNTSAENRPQTEVVVEHLMRRRIPIVLVTVYQLAEPFLISIPQTIATKLMVEYPGERWEYGKDWVTIGYRPSPTLLMQAVAKSEDIRALYGKDLYGTPLREISMLKSLRTIRDISFVMQVTGLLGVFDNYLQYFQTAEYKPPLAHGCTSITVPEGYIYLDSGQIVGLLEGIAGAAWYSAKLSNRHPERPADEAQLINTGLGIAQLAVLALIALGNLLALTTRRREV